MIKIIDHDCIKARLFFLKEESYFTTKLPPYFTFQNLINKISNNSQQLSKLKISSAKPLENVNYHLLTNKDGKFAWRPLQLIHPVLYVSLIHKITEPQNWKTISDRFKEFRNNPKISCTSIPVESENNYPDTSENINNWWNEVEQKSLTLALKYQYVLHTDITDCYGSIYTHSIPWALHSKEIAKKCRSNSLLGNLIDQYIQAMSFGQTNGIPQGSVLMDFIAEMVLGYADLNLSEKLKEEKIRNYEITRHRDDYRIFSNNPMEAEYILKLLTEILIDLGMRLNPQKTFVSENVVRDSIKPDKRFWNSSKQYNKNLQKQLFLIHELSEKFPNSGSLMIALTKYHKRIIKFTKKDENIEVLVSILVDIAYKNPRTYSVIAGILSKLLSLITAQNRDDTLLAIRKKFEKLPNTGYLEVWLQRMTIKLSADKPYEENLCKILLSSDVSLWNNAWLGDELKNIMNCQSIVNNKKIEQIGPIIFEEEVDIFYYEP